MKAILLIAGLAFGSAMLIFGIWIGMHTHHTVYKNCNGMTIEAPKDLAI